MESGTQPKEASPGYWIGGCVLGAAITQFPIGIGAIAGMLVSTGLGGLKTFYVPFIQRWLNLSPQPGNVFLDLIGPESIRPSNLAGWQ